MIVSDQIEEVDEASPSEATKLTAEEINSMEVEELYEILLNDGTEEGWNHVLGLMTAEKMDEFIAYLIEIGAIEEPEVEEPETVEVTDAGPLLEFVRPRRMMMRAVKQTNPYEDNGLYLNKTVETDEEENTFIRLEVYTTGTVTTTTTTNPLDIVLVLDQSGSMAYGFDGNSTNINEDRRQYAMKEAVKAFIEEVYKKTVQASDGGDVPLVDNRIGIVTFGSSSETLIGLTKVGKDGKGVLDGIINNLPDKPSGATRVDLGVEEAATILSSSEHDKVVIVFTDGIPTKAGNNTGTSFQEDVATAAIKTAKNIENATIYSIGIFNGADPDELYGEEWSYLTSNIKCDGEVGSFWGASVLSGLLSGNDFEDIDIAAGNRFLNYLSSNFEDATEIGVERGTYNPGNVGGIVGYGTGYKITKNFDRTASSDDQYYLTAADADSLTKIFKSISEQISTPDITLGSDTVVRDVISPYFKLPDGTGTDGIRYYTAECTEGNKTDGFVFDDEGKTLITSGVSATVADDQTNKTLEITGFDFTGHFVSEDIKEDNTHGQKLIIEIPIEPDYTSGTFGGEDFVTNGEESGVYRTTQTGEQEKVGIFEQPTTSIPVKYSFDTQDMTIYLGNGLSELSGVLKTDVDGFIPGNPDVTGMKNNEKVTITYKINVKISDNASEDYYYRVAAGKSISEGSWVDENGEASGDMSRYLKDRTECTVSAVIASDGDKSNYANAFVAGTEENVPVTEETALIYIAEPEIPFKDSSIYLGQKLTDYSDNRQGDILWKVQEDDILDGKSAPQARGDVPSVYVTGYSPEAGTSDNFERDTDIKVAKVKVGSLEFQMTDASAADSGAGYVSFSHGACSESGCSDKTIDGQFRIHVKPCELTIHKSANKLENDEQTFLFIVKGQGKTWQASVEGNGSVTLTGLRIGEYSVTEDSEWSWRYKPENGQETINLSPQNSTAVITITNELKSDKWLTNESTCTNTFKPISDSSSTDTEIVADVKSLRAMRGEEEG